MLVRTEIERVSYESVQESESLIMRKATIHQYIIERHDFLFFEVNKTLTSV